MAQMFTNEQARRLREQAEETQEEIIPLARRFRCSEQTMRSLLYGKSYRNAGGPIRTPSRKRNAAVLSDQEFEEMING